MNGFVGKDTVTTKQTQNVPRMCAATSLAREVPSKHTTSLQRRYNVAATLRRCSDVVTTLMRRSLSAENNLHDATKEELQYTVRTM